VLRPPATLASRAIVASAEAAMAADLTRTMMDRLLASPAASDLADMVAKRVLASRAAERMADDVIDSGLLGHVMDRLLASDDLWNMIDEIAASPAVTAAITRQSMGLADQVAEVVRDRSNRADDRLERAVHRLLRRNGGPAAASGEGSPIGDEG
jgi:hypothetical protein